MKDADISLAFGEQRAPKGLRVHGPLKSLCTQRPPRVPVGQQLRMSTPERVGQLSGDAVPEWSIDIIFFARVVGMDSRIQHEYVVKRPTRGSISHCVHAHGLADKVVSCKTVYENNGSMSNYMSLRISLCWQ